MCLVARRSDNVLAISDVLTATDGLLGDALNLWVVATTNARDTEIDPALLRPGRLCEKIDVSALTPAESAAVFRRLTGRDAPFDRPATLAEVYARSTNQEERDDSFGA